MATHDYIVDNQNGANFRSDLNNALAAIVSNNSSATAPTTTYAFMLWADTASDLLKQRNAADSAWVDILTLSTGAVAIGVPSGGIMMWSGLVSAIPSGWSLCDGTGGTPNLVGKFIKGASSAGGTGGSSTTDGHTLTEAEMPSHTHFRTPYTPGSGAAYAASAYNSFFDGASGTTSSTGGGGSHSHTFEPPYFELCYIIKD